MLQVLSKSISVLILMSCFSLLLASCAKDEDTNIIITKRFGIFTVSHDETSARMNGVVKDASIGHFNKMIAQYPEVKLLNLVDVPGSEVTGDNTTDSALELGRAIYRNNLNTHLVDDGHAASGGVDILASGRRVTVGENTEIGVHSWSGGYDGDENGTAWEIRFDEDHIAHQKYVRYFEDIGFSDGKASEFYFFTIRRARANNIHIMTDLEISQYLLR